MAGRRRRHRVGQRGISALVAVCACALACACGQASTRKSPPLAPAGSPRDDERGILARLSAGDALAPAPRAPARPPTPKDGSRSRYDEYRFDRSPRPFTAPSPYAGRYLPAAPAQPGAVSGVVTWPDPPRAPARLAVADRADRCRGGVPNRSLSIGEGGAVAGAVVYLEDIPTGRLHLGRLSSSYPNQSKHLQTGGAVEWRECGFHPPVQVTAPIGSVLSLITVDEAIRISATRVEGRARAALWSIFLGAPGAVHERLLDRHGFVELRAQAGAHISAGWVVVAPHPYFAVTDERGRFSLEEVPPGAYTVVVWHQPVVVGLTSTGESATHSVPLVRRRVVVKPRQEQQLIMRLPPAR